MHGCSCVTKPLRAKVLEERYMPWYAHHRGIEATVKAVEKYFYQASLRQDVDKFVKVCLICQKVKYDRQKTPGSLQPLQIPNRPQQSIAMDFDFDLPRTQIGHDGIQIIIHRFSKQAHFIPVSIKGTSLYDFTGSTA